MAITFVKKEWIDSIIERLDTTVSRTPVTKTTDPITGAETLTTGSAADILAIFVRRNKRWTFDKEGLIEGGDAYMIVKDTVTLNKDDIITFDSKQYRVQDIIKRYTDNNQSTEVYKYANLFVIQ